MHQTGVHAAQSHQYPLLVDRFVPELRIICVAIISDAVALDSVSQFLALFIATLVNQLDLHLARLLVDGRKPP